MVIWLKRILFSIAILASGVSSAQSTTKNNFFKDINSIDVAFGFTGDSEFCGINESQLRPSVNFVLSNTPLKKINSNAIDTLYFSFMVMNVKNKGSQQSLGCTVVTQVSLLRFVDFKGKINVATVWDDITLDVGTKQEAPKSAADSVEMLTKKFISKWTEQR
jgi:hypothetical protein